MKAVHKAVLTVFAKQDEESSKIRQALASLVPFNLEKEKIKTQQQTAKGFEEKKIQIFTIELAQTRHANEFVKSLLKALKQEQKDLLLRQAESRLDGDLIFFIRLDKQKYVEKKEFYITDSGDCFHIRLSIAAFPSNREKALETIEKLLKQA